MDRSFGIEATPISMRWEDLMRGPSIAEVGAHLHRIVNYRALTSTDAEQSAAVVPFPLAATGDQTPKADRDLPPAKRAA